MIRAIPSRFDEDRLAFFVPAMGVKRYPSLPGFQRLQKQKGRHVGNDAITTPNPWTGYAEALARLAGSVLKSPCATMAGDL